MKKYLLITFILLSCTVVKAQNLSFSDLLNLTNMNDEQSHDFLSASKGFKETGNQTLNGKAYKQYSATKGDKTEIVLVGDGVNNMSGSMTHEIVYTALQEQDINNLLAQAKKSTLTLVFQGADQSNNIYRFDNSLFRASISLAFDKKSGNVNVQQK